MAHATVEWTENLRGQLDVKRLLEIIAEEMRENADGAFPVGGIRVRAIAIQDYVIADGCDRNDAFIDINVKMGVGRSKEFQKNFFQALFERVKFELRDLFDLHPLALSLYVVDIEGWKHNTIHDRLRSGSS